MKKFVTTGIVNLGSGLVELSDDQAKPRAHRLTAKGDGIYEITGPVVLKAGEQFGCDDLPKSERSKVEPLETEPEPEAKTEGAPPKPKLAKSKK